MKPEWRVPKTTRWTPAGINEIQRWADHYNITWSAALRRLAQVGAAHAPDQWPADQQEPGETPNQTST
jgi:hypothetical protein